MTLCLGEFKGFGFGEFEVGEDIRKFLVLLPVFCWTFNSCLQFKPTCVKPLPANSIGIWASLTLLSKPHHPSLLEHVSHCLCIWASCDTVTFLRLVVALSFFTSPASSSVSN